MKRLLVTLAALALLVGAAACSSSGSKNASGDTSSNNNATHATGKTAAAKPLCTALDQFGSEASAQSIGTNKTQWAAAAAKIKTVAATISTTAPAEISTAAKAYATAMTNAATQMSNATSTGKALAALSPLIYNRDNDHNIAAFSAWTDKNC
jgi:hypothetical protein